MANCPNCNKEVSDQAKTCPNCGHPLKGDTLGGKLDATVEKLKNLADSQQARDAREKVASAAQSLQDAINAPAGSPQRKKLVYWAGGIGAALAFIIILVLLFSGTDVSCDSSSVKSTVVSIFKEKVLGKLGVPKDQLDALDMKLEDVRTLNANKENSRCACIGNLEINTPKGRETMRIKYEAYPRGDKGEIYVELDTDTLFKELFTLGLRHMND